VASNPTPDGTEERKGFQMAETETQTMPMDVKPTMEHEWLQRIVGEWVARGEATMGPGQQPQEWTGTETVRPIGNLWVQGEGMTDMPGQESGITQITLGFDPQKKRFVGTFIGSTMANLWVYDGSLEGNVLTLDSEGPAMKPGEKPARFKDVVELKDNDTRLLTSYMAGPDGEWQQVMTAEYTRKK
jgi:hypothetical protein